MKTATASLRTYLAAVLLLAVLPAAAMLAWQVWNDIDLQRRQAEEEVLRSATALAGAIDRELASSVDALTVLSQSEIFQQGRIAAMGRLLQGRPRRDWDSIFLLDANGGTVLDTAQHGHSLPRDVLRDLHARALKTGGAAVSGPTASPGIAIALPIMQADHVRYVLGVRTSDAVWTRLAMNAGHPEGGVARIFDSEGRLISQSAAGAAANVRLQPDAMRSMKDHSIGVRRAPGVDDEDVYAAWASVPVAGWYARVAMPAAPVDTAAREVVVSALSTTGLSLLVGLVLAALVASRIGKITAARDAEATNGADPREFLAMLSHELRNPVGAIAAAADVLETADPQSGSAAEAREIIARQSRMLAQSMHDLLDVGRVMGGEVQLSLAPLDLAQALRRVDEVLLLTGETNQRRISLDVEETWVRADAARIAQALSRLLINAIKSTPASRDVRVRLRRDGRVAELEIQDAREGIALALARNIVELHGGSLTSHTSEADSRVVVRLPAIDAPARDAGGGSLPPSRRRKVLVVESNAGLLQALRTKLEHDGHTVTIAQDGVDGLTQLLQTKPEVSIVDVALPGLSGYDLARSARAAGYTGRMIALSGRGDASDRDALLAGFDAHLSQPIDRDQLRASLAGR